MKINYLRESVFGSYKNKRNLSKEDKFKEIKKETSKISNKWFQENIANKIAEYYVPLINEYSKESESKERGIHILKDLSQNKKYDIVFDLEEVDNNKIILKQYVTSEPAYNSSIKDFYFTYDRTFEIFDEVEEYISNNFAPCEVKLVNCEIEGRAWGYSSDSCKLVPKPFLSYKNGYIEEISLNFNFNIISLSDVFRFFNRFEECLPELNVLNFNNCNSLTSLESVENLTAFKVNCIYLWGCVRLSSFKGYEDFMTNEDPTILYNINSILDRNRDDVGNRLYKIKSEYDRNIPCFEKATEGKLSKKYIEYLGEVRAKVEDNYEIRKSKDENDINDVNDAEITFFEYHLNTKKIKQYKHNPHTHFNYND